MKLKVGDIVEFKNYADMTNEEHMMIGKDSFPASGKVRKVFNNFDFFCIEGSLYAFNVKSIARVISDVDVNVINNLNVGDEVLAKVTVKGIFANGIRISSQIKTSDVVKILKRKEPEYFIIKESHYGMYIGTARELVSDKSKAKIYTSENVCNSDAKDMHLDAWEVLPYD
ncbi:MAG: hypothetical protein ACRC69_08545, partial [Acinetobacter baumannii]